MAPQQTLILQDYQAPEQALRAFVASILSIIFAVYCTFVLWMRGRAL